NTTELVKEDLNKLAELNRKVELQNESLDTLEKLAIAKANRLASIPSIKPVREDKLKRKISYLSGFGWRNHPIYHIKKFHKGIDFTSPKGTPIQATGNGVVKAVIIKKRGYGKHVIIDHGYGYETLYGHMSKILVKKGDKVVRGQTIGLVGSTGSSTAPHCHYEVHYKGKAINPIDFVFDGMTPEEYQEFVEKAKAENQSLD
ncbi:MAG TPA: M23 family metallopeptidase, partial [Saprospiraceae bacterium]|nr:M23 family metallopeptidase [Saprospiraceae bacterium]